MPENDSIQKLLEQYDLGDTGGDTYEGSTPRAVAPQQQRPAGIPATKAVPPKDEATGRFLPAKAVPSAPNAQRQTPSEDPLEHEPPDPPQVHEHNRTLFRHAVQTGFTDAEIDSTPSEELQEKVFNRQREMFTQAQQTPTPNISAVEKPVTAPEPEVQVDFSDLDKVVDADVANPIKAHLTNQLKQLKALEAKLEAQQKQSEEYTRQQQQKENDRNLDMVLSKHAQFLGNESISELYEGHPNLDRRREVIVLARLDKSKRSVQEKIDSAVAKLAPGWGGHAQAEAEPAPQRNGRPTAQDYANGGVPRPTNRKAAPEINDVKRARQAVQQRLEQLSQPGENGTVSVEDFPD